MTTIQRLSFLNQFTSFVGIGLIGTAAHYMLLIGLVKVFGVRAVLASMAGFVLGGSVNYYLNRRITFKSNKRHAEAVTKFFMVAFVGFVLNSCLMVLATEIFLIHYLVAQAIATGAVLLWTFSGSRFWTFAE